MVLDLDDLITPDDAAQRWPVPLSALRAAMRTGELTFYQAGRQRLLTKQDIATFLENRQCKSNSVSTGT
ncbi:MAG: helix-turn-helix domain-containing protein, partial [Woeseiaceae bacterium]